MNVNVNILPEDIDQAIIAKVLESKLGVKVNEAIAVTIAELHKDTYGRASVTKAINEEVMRIILELIKTQYRPAIEAKVRELITENRLNEIVNVAWEQLEKAINSRLR